VGRCRLKKPDSEECQKLCSIVLALGSTMFLHQHSLRHRAAPYRCIFALEGDSVREEEEQEEQGAHI